MMTAEKPKLTERSTTEKLKFTARVIAGLREHLESLMYYPHPFVKGGFVVVFKDTVDSFLDRVSVVYQSHPPPELSIHCLRRSELFELAFPSLYLLHHRVYEHTHLALFLKHKGTVLYGLDLRAEIPAPLDHRILLENQLEGCMLHFRAHGLLSWLASKEYLVLIAEVDKQFRYLMGTALLAHGVWDIQMESVPEQFAHYFKNQPAAKTWDAFQALPKELDAKDEAACRTAAFETVWLFESFLRQLRESVQ